jgi:hypothetical protein
LPTGQDDATFTKVSAAEFTLSAPFAQGGQKLTYVDDCKKAT